MSAHDCNLRGEEKGDDDDLVLAALALEALGRDGKHLVVSGLCRTLGHALVEAERPRAVGARARRVGGRQEWRDGVVLGRSADALAVGQRLLGVNRAEQQ